VGDRVLAAQVLKERGQRRKPMTDVATAKPAPDQPADAELGQQDRQVGGIEAGDRRLDDEVVVFARAHFADHGRAGAAAGRAGFDDPGFVGMPVAVVVVAIDHRDPEAVGRVAQGEDHVGDLLSLGRIASAPGKSMALIMSMISKFTPPAAPALILAASSSCVTPLPARPSPSL